MKKRYHLTQEELDALVERRVREARARAEEDHERDLLMRQADIRALTSQINPHFLYNALESIRGQAIADNSPEIALMTQTLAKFFRYSISAKGDMVTLRDELENVANYMLIQHYRFGDRFSYSVRLDGPAERIERTPIPKLSLQPIVENAIVHGLADTTEGGLIEINASLSGGSASVTVRDNGRGIPEDRLRELLGMLGGGEDSLEGHVGLRNVDRRLRLSFGPAYGLTVMSREGEGTSVELLLPAAAEGGGA